MPKASGQAFLSLLDLNNLSKTSENILQKTYDASAAKPYDANAAKPSVFETSNAATKAALSTVQAELGNLFRRVVEENEAQCMPCRYEASFKIAKSVGFDFPDMPLLEEYAGLWKQAEAYQKSIVEITAEKTRIETAVLPRNNAEAIKLLKINADKIGELNGTIDLLTDSKKTLLKSVADDYEKIIDAKDGPDGPFAKRKTAGEDWLLCCHRRIAL